MKRTPLKARREAPRRMTGRSEHEWGAGMADLPDDLRWAATRELIYWRAGGRCEVCGDGLHGSMEAHHRLKRRYGPDCPCNALALCSRCHHGRVHGEPAAATAEGWMLSSTRLGVVPASEPVTIRGRTAYLSCDGGPYRFALTEVTPAGSVAGEAPAAETGPDTRSTP